MQIKKWTDGSVIREIEADSIKNAVELLVGEGANLREANLREADVQAEYA